MKRILTSLLMAGTLFVSSLASTSTAYAQKPIEVMVDGKQVRFDAPPEVLQGRTMIPIRAVVETMGAEVELSARDSFLIKKGSTQVKIVWNSQTAYVNGKAMELEVPAYTKQDRTYVPLRFVSEALAATVGYDMDTNTALVESFDPTGMTKASVESVHDGESFRVTVNGVSEEVRLAGVDAPDLPKLNTPGQPNATQASQYLRGQLAKRTIYLEYNAQQRDEEGRLVAYVYREDGSFINAEVLRNGFARILEDAPNRRYLELFNALMKEARSQRKGIWVKGDVPVTLPPAVPVLQKPASLKLAFPVISDVHVLSWDTNSQRKFKSVLEDLYAVDPTADALVLDGDLGNGDPNDYSALRRIVNTTPHPKNMYYVMGNHEYYKAWYNNGKASLNTFPNGETEEMSIQRFLQVTREQKVYYDRWLNGYHFIFLGSEKYRQSIPGLDDNAYLSPEQLNWLQDKLAESKDSKQPVFVFLHQPLPYTVSGSDESLGVLQFRELNDILRQYPQVMFFTGHTHYDLKFPNSVVRNGFTMVNTSAVNSPYSIETKTTDPGGSQGLYVEVHDSKVIIRGRDFAKRMWIPEAEHTTPLNETSN